MRLGIQSYSTNISECRDSWLCSKISNRRALGRLLYKLRRSFQDQAKDFKLPKRAHQFLAWFVYLTPRALGKLCSGEVFIYFGNYLLIVHIQKNDHLWFTNKARLMVVSRWKPRQFQWENEKITICFNQFEWRGVCNTVGFLYFGHVEIASLSELENNWRPLVLQSLKVYWSTNRFEHIKNASLSLNR